MRETNRKTSTAAVLTVLKNEEMTEPKFQPGQKAKVTGNENMIGGIYHTFEIGIEVSIFKFKPAFKAWLCEDANGNKQTIYESDLSPVNPEAL